MNNDKFPAIHYLIYAQLQPNQHTEYFTQNKRDERLLQTLLKHFCKRPKHYQTTDRQSRMLGVT